MSPTKRLVAIVCSLALVVGVAFAGAIELHNASLAKNDCPTSVAAQTSSTTAQSAVWSSTPIDPRATNGNPKIIVDANFETSAATCVVYVGRYHYDGTTYTLLGVKPGTLTASTTQTDAGAGSAKRYLAVAFLEFDAVGCNVYDVRMAQPSSGSATITHYAGYSATGDGN